MVSAHDRRILFLCTLLSAAVFAFDLGLPLGIAGGVPHALVVLLALRTEDRRYPLIFAGIGSLLVLAGLFLSEPGGLRWMVFVNRGLALFVIWMTAVLGRRLLRTRERLAESEDRFQLLADQAPLMVWGSASDGAWNFVSQGWREYTGRTLADERGEGWLDGLHPHDRGEVAECYRDALARHAPFQLECRLRIHTGNHCWVALQGAPRLIRGTEFVGFIGTALDVEQRKQAERQLNETMQKYFHREKMATVGTLTAGLLHEIGNPVAGISGLLQVVLDSSTRDGESVDPDRQRHYLEQALAELDRLTRITQSVGNFAALADSDAGLQDINDLIERACWLMSHDERMAAIALERDLDRTVPALRLIPDLFIQLLLNLLANARDACIDERGEGRVTITTQRDGNQVVMEVEDSGSGMTPEVLARAGEPFFTTKPSGAGLGLGLALCRSLANELGGELKIESAVDVGTRVQVRFPAADACAGRAAD